MLIIMTGMFATFLSCSIPIFWLKTVKFVGWDVIKQNWHLILLVAFSHGISTTLENVSIDKTSISFNQIIKATTPVFTMSYGYFFEKRRLVNSLFFFHSPFFSIFIKYGQNNIFYNII